MKLREAEEKIIKEVDWNGNHYTFANSFHSTGTRSHDILTMEDQMGNRWTGETTWINRPWHRFDLEEALDEIVSKAFGPKALQLVKKLDEESHSVEEVIDKFFAQFKPEDIQNDEVESEEVSRKELLAQYLGVDESELEEVDENLFVYDDAEYLVLDDTEADEEFDTCVRNFWDDMGLDGVASYFKEWVLENAIDESELEDYVREDISDYYYELEDEEVADEAVEEGIVESEEVYDKNSDEWSPELRDDVNFDDLREKLIDLKFEGIESYSEYLQDMGFGEEFFRPYIDEEKVIEALKDDIEVNGQGRGQEIAYYDGDEIDLGHGLYAYRRN